MSRGRLGRKRVVVTGAGSGLGRVIAQVFLREGAEVIVTDIDTNSGEAVAKEIGARFFHHDVTNDDDWKALFAFQTQREEAVDVLINNAGSPGSSLGELLEDIDIGNSQRIFSVNFDGTLLGCKHAIRHMRNKGGSIINMSSIAAMLPTPTIASYGAAKAAVRHLTQSVALYCAENNYPIRCNSIHPGQIRTPMHDRLVAATAAKEGISEAQAEMGFLSKIPTGEFAREEDIANAALYLACEESRNVTGDRILVDGGMMLSN